MLYIRDLKFSYVSICLFTIIHISNLMSERFRGNLMENNKFVKDEIEMIQSGARLPANR